MSRKNGKKAVISYENSIKKSNQFSIAKLNHGLTLNQMQLLAYAIYSAQKDGKTEFNKAAFEKKFGIEKYQTKHAKEDVEKLFDLKFSTVDLENSSFEFLHVFQKISYNSGLFAFKWTDDVVPHILELKDKYVLTDLTITSQFKSQFSWTLYDFLRAHYGYWRKPLSKEALMRLFGVENKSYQSNTALLKRKVLDVAIAEINNLTELEVWYKEKKKGRAIVGFDLFWSTGEKVIGATKKQVHELNTILNTISDDMFKYIDLNEEKNRQESIELVRKAEELRRYTAEPICITKERADRLIMDSRWIMQRLEQLKEVDRNPRIPMYNWLEDSE